MIKIDLSERLEEAMKLKLKIKMKIKKMQD